MHQVLLAEDDDEMRALIALRLRGEGYDVVESADGLALLAQLTLVRANLKPMPSLIVTDIHLPGASGLSALHTVGDLGWKVPVLLMTAFGTEETLNAAARLGAEMVLHKPFDLNDFSLAVRCLVPRELRP
jgi:two-component system nitrogen regulation response regulator GlnG